MTKNDLFETIYDEFANSLFRFCMFRLKNKEIAQDIVAEAFLRLYEQNIEKIEFKKAWLYRVCSNLIYDLKVRKNTENQSLPAIPEVLEQIANENEDIESLTIKAQNVTQIKEELEKFDELTATIITLRIWEEMQFKEIEEIVGISEGAIKKRFYRGINSLHTILK